MARVVEKHPKTTFPPDGTQLLLFDFESEPPRKRERELPPLPLGDWKKPSSWVSVVRIGENTKYEVIVPNLTGWDIVTGVVGLFDPYKKKSGLVFSLARGGHLHVNNLKAIRIRRKPGEEDAQPKHRWR